MVLHDQKMNSYLKKIMPSSNRPIKPCHKMMQDIDAFLCTCILYISGIIIRIFNFNIIYSDIHNINHYVFGMDGSNGDYCRPTSADTKINLIAIQCTLKWKQPQTVSSAFSSKLITSWAQRCLKVLKQFTEC